VNLSSAIICNSRKKTPVRTVQKSNRKILERGKIDTLKTQIHDRSLSYLGTGTSIRSSEVKLDLWDTEIELFNSLANRTLAFTVQISNELLIFT